MPDTDIVTVSKKIENKKEQERLKQIITSLLPENTGAIMRTSSSGKSKEEIVKDVENLNKTWKKIQQNANLATKYPKLIFESNSSIEKLLLDFAGKQIGKIVIDTKEIYEELKKLTNKLGMENIEISLEENLKDKYNLNSQLEEIKNRKIWLKCGGFITIDKTEALTAIDVNSGKYIGSKNLEQTVFIVNKEATQEIAKQLKLRDLGGIIIIDYIDMEKEENKEKIIEFLKEELKKDRSKTQVAGFTNLNLLEMTRKHIG